MSSSEFDPEAVRAEAARRLSEADALPRNWALMGLLLGYVIGAALAGGAAPATFVVALVSGGMGWVVGQDHASRARVDAQLSLCQLSMEANLRAFVSEAKLVLRQSSAGARLVEPPAPAVAPSAPALVAPPVPALVAPPAVAAPPVVALPVAPAATAAPEAAGAPVAASSDSAPSWAEEEVPTTPPPSLSWALVGGDTAEPPAPADPEDGAASEEVDESGEAVAF